MHVDRLEGALLEQIDRSILERRARDRRRRHRNGEKARKYRFHVSFLPYAETFGHFAVNIASGPTKFTAWSAESRSMATSGASNLKITTARLLTGETKAYMYSTLIE